MQIFFNKACALNVHPHETIEAVKLKIQARTGIPSCHQRLIYGGRQLHDDRTLQESSVGSESTLHLVLRLRGGKGGFGALLRGAGRAALTDNFDACRDLSGRRMRHVNADKKLVEWQAEARERELEKVGLKHIKAQEKAAQREAKQQVDMDDVRLAQEAALANVMDAMESALEAKRGAKRPAPLTAGAAGAKTGGPAAKKKARRVFANLDDALSSDSEEDDDVEADVAAAGVAAPTPAQSLSNSCVAVIREGGGSPSRSSGSEQEPLHAALARGGSPHSNQEVTGSVLEAALSAAEQAPSSQGTSALRPAANSDNARSAEASAPAPAVAAASMAENSPTEAASVAENAPEQAALAPVASSTGTARGGGGREGIARIGSTAGTELAAAPSMADSNLKTRQQSNGDAAKFEPVDLQQYASAAELESLGLERLKAELQRAGLKCGGSLAERAARLFLLKSTPLESIDKKHLARPAKKG